MALGWDGAALARMAEAWEGVGGVRFQMFGSDQHQCPSDAECDNAIPFAIGGSAGDSFDIVVSMNTSGIFDEV